MRLLITGSRHYSDKEQMRSVLLLWSSSVAHPSEITIVHGAAPGADTLADEVAKELGMNVEAHPAKWETLGRSAGPRRNQDMVDAGAYACLAFPLGESRGTRDCMARARAANIPIYVMTD